MFTLGIIRWTTFYVQVVLSWANREGIQPSVLVKPGCPLCLPTPNLSIPVHARAIPFHY